MAVRVYVASDCDKTITYKYCRTMDFGKVKDAATGRCGDIIEALTPLTSEVVNKGRNDHPCPLCDGKSVIWPDTRPGHEGSVACRNCTDNKPTGDIIATVKVFGGHANHGEAAKAIADYLGIDAGSGASASVDIIEQVAKAKRMPLEAFKLFGPTIESRGRNRNKVVRVPVYNEAGEVHSYFDMTPRDKGFFKRGEGSSGMFFPGQLPQPGETWCLVEGVKDAAALIGNGYQACGLPASKMHVKYAKLFKGVDVIIVPDLDEVGQHGASVTASRLAGIAASVKVARLPGEITETKGDDVRDVLRNHGVDAIREAIDNAVPWVPSQSDKEDRRPAVMIDLNFGRRVQEVIYYVSRLGWESPWIPEDRREAVKVYRRGGVLVEVVVEKRPDATTKDGRVKVPKGAVRIRDLPPQQVPVRIAEACRTYVEQVTEDGIVRVDVQPPYWLVGAVYTDASSLVRPLEGIVTAPTLRVDGSILQTPGWDEVTGLVYRPSLEFATVPEEPSQADAVEAVTKLTELVVDFPFAHDADRAAWVAMVLSMIGRPCVEGQVPLFAVTANIRGSGKSMLVDVGSIIAYGHVASRTPYCSDDREMRKQITSVAIEAAPAVLLDNVEGSIGGASLDAVLTSGRWKDRVLGQSRTFDGEIRTVWTTTGNNLSFRSDIARRVLPIRLHSILEHPEERTDFHHQNLLGHVQRHRAELVRSALTILRAYFAAGCPVQPGGTFGSFESWSEVVRGAVVWSGMADPLKTRETATAEDESFAIVRGLIGGLIEMDDTGEGLTAADIIERLRKSKDDEPDPYPMMRTVVAEMISKPDARKLGYQLRKYKDRHAGGFKVQNDRDGRNISRWVAVRVSGDAGDTGDTFAHQGVTLGCVSHTDTRESCDTHIPEGSDWSKPSPACPVSPESCPDCGGAMIPSEVEVNGWRNFDCEDCGKVLPFSTGVGA